MILQAEKAALPSCPVIRKGNKGLAVKKLQKMLADAGIDPGQVDGVFGVVTEKALKVFQKRAGLPQNGISDERTWASLLALKQVQVAKQVPVKKDNVMTPVPEKVFVGFDGCEVYCFNDRTGRQLWKTSVDRELRPVRAADSKRVYVIDRSQKVYALNRNSGQIVWSLRVLGSGVPAREEDAPVPVLVGSTLLLMAPGGERIIAALDPKNGEIMSEDKIIWGRYIRGYRVP
ncbi:MAG: hypothetical protein CVU89_10265 [Firmicutes bacterium HGW-Firmicutes-14]|nr:MAG: hypothetical protein CVU89_10265 [Firmicutes bacterium HGW-Firmicutes-14]